jgi:hypothetical protein
MRIQHFGAGFVIFQDIYDILVLMHELMLHAKNGVYLIMLHENGERMTKINEQHIQRRLVLFVQKC